MNHEHRSNLKKALLSQTWNNALTSAVLQCIEADLQKPKQKKSPSALQLAVEGEKGRKFKSGPAISEGSEES
ncbi:MAG: hypothetical protein QGG94_03905 [Prochlorococcaceae cyanobacterium ETNP1_MAG_9]|nr:hypothetical protein [Prochlorococcaceae cyanobacterium ETNP1_MAG_9]